MTADERFKELGYKKEELGKKVHTLCYSNGYKYIYFDLEYRTIEIVNIDEIDIYLLKIINQKFKELGWLIEEVKYDNRV